MKIVIIGGGTVGSAICAQLAGEGHDITVIDTDFSVLTEMSTASDVFGVMGNGAEISTMQKADVAHADLVIAVTSSDEVNILCCTAARKLGAKHTVARVRNPEYSELMQLLKSDMNLSMTINPELAAAKEIYRMLRFPSAAKIDTFCRGRVELAEFIVPAESPLCGVTLNDLRSRLSIRFLVCGVLRGGKAIIPSGYFTPEAGDRLFVTMPDEEVSKFFKAIGAYKHPVKNVLIVGGGRVTYYLLGMLRKAKIDPTVIEENKTLCHEIAEEFACTVINDSGTKQDLLLEESIGEADAFLALSDNDEENAIVSLYAKNKCNRKVITLIGSMSYADLFRDMGLDSIISPKTSTASYILRYVRAMSNVIGSEIESLHKIMEGNAEAIEFKIKKEIDGLTGIPLKDLGPKLKSGVLIACIARNNKVIIPGGGDCLEAGDTVITVTTLEQIKGIEEILK